MSCQGKNERTESVNLPLIEEDHADPSVMFRFFVMALLGYGRKHNLSGRKDQLRTFWTNLGEEEKKDKRVDIFAPRLLLFVGEVFALEPETCMVL